jgi:hypothetical protein
MADKENTSITDPLAPLWAEINSARDRLASLETKMDDLFMRPRMPYSQDASSGDILELDSNLEPQWVTP